MIVVVGALVHGADRSGPGEVAGRAGAIARAAVAAGAEVQAVARVGEDASGDALVVALGRCGIGHAALLRDPARPTPVLAPVDAENDATDAETDALEASAALDASDALDDPARPAAPGDDILPADPALRPTLEPADLELALRYLPGIRTIVVADPAGPALARVVAAAASWAGARVVALADERAPASLRDAYGEDATVLALPASDPDEAFASVVGRFAALLDGGREPAIAFREAVTAGGWEHAELA